MEIKHVAWRRFARRAEALGLPLLAFGDCARCVRAQPGILAQHSAAYAVLAAGADVLLLDSDAVLLRDPRPYLLGRGVDALVKASLDCFAHTQFLYARATAAARDFWYAFTTWLYRHGDHEFEQSAFSSFLLRGAGLEVPDARGAPALAWERLEDTPRRFVELTEYWTGDASEVVLAHKCCTSIPEKRALLGVLLGDDGDATRQALEEAWRPGSFFRRLPQRNCSELGR